MIQKIQKAIVNGLYYTANLLCLAADLLSPTSDEIWRGRQRHAQGYDVPGNTDDVIDKPNLFDLAAATAADSGMAQGFRLPFADEVHDAGYEGDDDDRC